MMRVKILARRISCLRVRSGLMHLCTMSLAKPALAITRKPSDGVKTAAKAAA